MFEQLIRIVSGLDFWIYAAMVFLFIAGMLLCVVPLVRIAEGLRKAQGQLERRDAEGHFLYAQADFLHLKNLDACWKRYLINLEEMRKSGGECDVHIFLNSATVIHGPGHSPLGEMLPGMLTSLGILGTFYGLVHGVSALDITSSQTMGSSIVTLVDGLSVAFRTSIVGVLLALLFQLMRRMAISMAERALNHFIGECHARISRPYTQDTRMLQLLHSLLMETRETNDLLRKRNDR